MYSAMITPNAQSHLFNHVITVQCTVQQLLPMRKASLGVTV